MNRIKELRLSSNFTQTQIAEKIGVNQTAIGKYERGEIEPNFLILKKLCEIFQCSVDYLIGFSDDFGNVTVQTTGEELTEDEKRLLSTYRKLSTKNRMHVSAYAQIRLEEQDGGEPSLRFK